LLLTERVALYYTPTVRVWRFDVATGIGQPVLDRAVSPLTGNSLVLPGATEAFLGFDVQYQSAYKLDLQTLDLVWFSTGFALPHPPRSAFERYALEVVGVYEPGAMDAWLSGALPAGTYVPETALSPWLHWPLPDTARSITCYPDSSWTRSQFEFTCPGLSSPRPYDGHQGTDVGGQFEGLRVGTPVYATAPGVVIERFTQCQPNDVPCNGAYGNTVTVEHVRVSDGNTQIWHTGYAHLSRVLAEPGTAVSDIGVAIALSGDTGIGGPHLHFEVRYPFGTRFTRWIDPWEVVDGGNLWLGDSDIPPSAAGEVAVLLVCRTADGNNVRSGPGTAFEIAAETRADTPYAVVTSELVTDGGAQGEWYQIREGDGAPLGWVWSGLMTDCLPPGTME
jgi:murein DD-endopeptidase MepM/ murein hydrolase activator NlpD